MLTPPGRDKPSTDTSSDCLPESVVRSNVFVSSFAPNCVPVCGRMMNA
ncbi:MAG: hypothetical protein HC933_01785 [Pleurocapsa sp. SU_196_0]|nr:hypothetical protein [Pleurocapsa sp. SU_196_0]